ncbi:MAG TPA: zinc-binding dehydrogenase [Stellaceae bacterium]|jgi:NADPH:quinone reductase-like Zn-dependent oxidoreductase|nr:zinc-binding dehydrogenase [Stellaceae bacterium]
MRAIVNTKSAPGGVAIVDVPEPEPRSNEAVVAVHAFSLNRGELRLIETRGEGWRPGQDIAGVVVTQAADGSGPAAGTRVVGLCDWHGWAERAAVPSHRMAAIADSVSYGAAAALPVAGLTALRCLRNGEPLLGRRVLVTGAAGGVGNLAVQMAARSGARVTAVVGSGTRAAVLDGLGAEAVVVGIENAPGRYALILESAGGQSLSEAMALIEAKGTIVVYGNSSGEPATLNFRDFADHQNARIQGFHYFTCEAEDRFAPDLALMAGLVADGSLRPRLVEHDWREFPTIGPLLRDRHIGGKAVFHIDQA